MSTDTAAGGPKTTNGPPNVPFQSLYRRFRPQRFSEVRGQDHVTNTLRNAVSTGRVAHAYLFSGPRGTGKTSTARILAKALNCTNLEGGEPCGQCESCQTIAAGTSFDVHELDAASNNGVDAMRDLVARSSLASPGRWKVYIVDEVHMLSTAASNALLKTLEEPPEHVIFVLATTDPQKVLLTIRSRTQHFEFHLLNEDVLESLLNDVASNASLSLPEGAIDVARRRGKGSARDALSVLDQVSTAGVVQDDSDALSNIVRALANSSTAGAIEALEEALHNGRDPYQVAIELVERMRTGFLRLVAPKARLDDLAKSETAEVESLGAPRCVRAMEVIGGAIQSMRDAPEPRITLEVALIRLTHPDADDSPDALLDRIDRLERRIESTGPQRQATPRPPTPPLTLNAPDDSDAPAQSLATPAAPAPGQRASGRPALGAFQRSTNDSTSTPEQAVDRPAAPLPEPTNTTSATTSSMPTRDAIVSAWGDHLLVGLRAKVRAYYQAGRFVGVEGNDALIALPNDAHIARATPLRKEVESALSSHFGRAIGLRLLTEGPDFRSPEPTDDTVDETNKDKVVVAAQSEDEIAEPDFDVEGVQDPKLGVAWAEDRLRAAFPGAEEVTT